MQWTEIHLWLDVSTKINLWVFLERSKAYANILKDILLDTQELLKFGKDNSVRLRD